MTHDADPLGRLSRILPIDEPKTAISFCALAHAEVRYVYVSRLSIPAQLTQFAVMS